MFAQDWYLIRRKEASSMKEIVLLKKWLKKPGNSPATLAAALGYKTSASINMWIKRNSIPSHQLKNVLEIIKGDL